MNKKIYIIIIGALALIVLAVIFVRALVSGPTVNPNVQTISIDNTNKDISKLGIKMPLDQNDALLIAKNFCNLNLQKNFTGDVYGQIGDLNDRWFIQMNIVNCLCGVVVDKKTGQTTCYKTLSPSDTLILK